MESICESCANFIKHYGIKEGYIFRICCGHCVAKDCEYSKRRRVCKGYKQSEEDFNIKTTINVFNELVRVEYKLKEFDTSIKKLKDDILKIAKLEK